MKILLTVAYDGTQYFGYQRQKGDPVITIEQRLSEACSSLFRQEVVLTGASRTDRGVHALGQRVSMEVDTTIPVERLARALNGKLPLDIRIQYAQEVEQTFHPRYDCVRKTYEYTIYNSDYPNPMLRNYAEFIYQPLCLEKMQEAAVFLCGMHDFKAFCAAHSNVKSTVRTIFALHVAREGKLITIYVSGDGFLYNMVRIIAGTLIYTGLGKIKPQEVESILRDGDRSRAGKTAGPQGLVLKEIFYK